MSNYSSQLRDRRWQKRRLEILERDDFTCRMCGSQENSEQIHVHHIYYKKGLAVWEYPDSALVSLCATCHADVSSYVNELLETIFARFPDLSFIDSLTSAISSRGLHQLSRWLCIPPGSER